MGRNKLEITKEELIEALDKSSTQAQAGELLGCSQGTISNLMTEYGIEATAIGETEADEALEMPDYTFDQTKKILNELQKVSRPSIGYNDVKIKITTNYKILLIPQADWHIGARYVDYDQLLEDLEFIARTPNVYAGLCGDYCDNYNTSAYKAGQIEQAIPIQNQKAHAETMIKKMEGKILWFVNGCHDEWSYISDGFELAQFLAHKNQQGYYMGHNGIIRLTIGDITYKLYVTHNTLRNSGGNDGHGLKYVCREDVGFDIGIKAHNHKPHIEEFIMRRKRRYVLSCGTYKGQDRYGSKRGYPHLRHDIPGILLHPKKKEAVLNIDYRELVKYL